MDYNYYGNYISLDKIIQSKDKLFSTILLLSSYHQLCHYCYYNTTSIYSSNCYNNNHICDICLYNYIHVIINGEIINRVNKDGNIKCHCYNCNNIIPENTILRILNHPNHSIYKSSNLRRYQTLKYNTIKRFNEGYVWCPHPGCETLIKKDIPHQNIDNQEEKGDSNNLYQKLTICTTCNYHFCVICKEEYTTNEHEQVFCEEIIPDNILLYRKQSEKVCKRCPNCRVTIEKNDGCNHMTCTQCHYEFCWLCKRKWRTCCDDVNILKCFGRGLLKHRIWGQKRSVRYTTKAISLPIITTAAIGIGATGIGVGICGATIAGIGYPIYYTGKYIRRKLQERDYSLTER